MAYDPYPPPQWGAPPPHHPPPPNNTGRTIAIIVGSVVGAIVLLPFLIGLLFFSVAFVSGTGAPVHREAIERPLPESATHERVPPDAHGPSFAVPAPLDWQVTADRADPLLGHVRLGFEGHGERIAVASYVEPELGTPELALAKTVRALKRRGYTTSVAPREGVVGGERALLHRLRVRDPKKAEVWVMVCVREGARFVVLYEGPPTSLEGPTALHSVVDDWRW